LTLKNITLEGNDDNNHAVIEVQNGGTLILDANTSIIKNNGGDYGGGVKVNGVEIMMNAGSVIRDNTGTFGGGVFIENRSTFSMEGAVISGNNANAFGGGVCIKDNSTLVFSSRGGTVDRNTAGDQGGGIYMVNHSKLVMASTASISRNKAGSGGGISAVGEGSIVMDGGYIRGNTANVGGALGGGGIYIKDVTLDMRQGSISGNKAVIGQGGGVYVDGGGGIFNMSGGSVTVNSVEEGNGNGAGVYIAAATFTLSGSGGISGNVIAPDAGDDPSGTGKGCGVYVSKEGTFKKEGGTIYGLTAPTGDHWADTDFQNRYGGFVMHNDPEKEMECFGLCNFCTQYVPGSERGYAVYLEQNTGSGIWLNGTLTRNDNFLSEGGMSRETQFQSDMGCRICDGSSQMIDTRDFSVYQIGEIGDDIWMLENLRYTPRVRDTDGNFFCQHSAIRTERGERLYAYPGEDGDYIDYNARSVWEAWKGDTKPGIMYNRYAAIGVCPEGWHLPTEGEWTGMIANGGFSALLTGYINDNKRFDAEAGAYFWTSSTLGTPEKMRRLRFDGTDTYSEDADPSFFFSVRCKKD
jgi:hypothetical protein